MVRKSITTREDLEERVKDDLISFILMLLDEKYKLECMLDKYKEK